MKRYRAHFCFIIAVISFLLAGFSCTGSKDPEPAHPYNVIVLVSDALRRELLGCYGGALKTPNIDWLAENGARFEKAYSSAPATHGSSVGLFTGNFLSVYRMPSPKADDPRVFFRIDDSEELIAEALGKQGYTCKCRIENPVANLANNLQGFSDFRKFEDLPAEDRIRIEEISGIKDHNSKDYKTFYGMLDFLAKVEENQNFYLHQWIYDPHAPYSPVTKVPVDPSKLSQPLGYYSTTYMNFMKELAPTFTTYETDYVKKLYCAEVESLDERVGCLLKILRDKNLLENTYIIFTADHGEMFGKRGKWGHGNPKYEELVHVPLIIYGPRIPGGTQIQSLVSHVDLMPTIKDLLGLVYKDNMQGKSLKNMLFEGREKDGFVYLANTSRNMNNEYVALLYKDYKLYSHGERWTELYDHKTDPQETKNIAEKQTDVVEKMKKIIAVLKEENSRRRELNMARSRGDQNLDEEMENTEESLRELGYIK